MKITGYISYTAKDRSHNDATLRELVNRLKRMEKAGIDTAYMLARIAEQRAVCVEVHGTSVY